MSAYKQQPPQRRRKQYVDQALQLWLLIALIALEIVMTALGTVYLYFEFDKLITAQLYTVHLPVEGNVQEMLLRVFYVLLGMTLVNTLALVVADRLWRSYVNRTLREMNRCIQALLTLDFTGSFSFSGRHRVLDLLASWFTREKRLFGEIRQQTEQLHKLLNECGEPNRLDQARHQARELRRLLSTTRRV